MRHQKRPRSAAAQPAGEQPALTLGVSSSFVKSNQTVPAAAAAKPVAISTSAATAVLNARSRSERSPSQRLFGHSSFKSELMPAAMKPVMAPPKNTTPPPPTSDHAATFEGASLGSEPSAPSGAVLAEEGGAVVATAVVGVAGA